MNSQPDSTTNAVQTTTSNPRCLHRTAVGRRCRFHASHPAALYCPRHASLHPNSPDATDLAPELLGTLTEIETPEDTQRLLSKLFVLLVQDRVSLKKASVLTYILQQLLRTLTAIERQNQYLDENQPTTIILDVPRPYRGPVVATESQPQQEPS
ncbi:MAG TPA: hypothetical protein VGI16_02165 [Candidatus Acidoferrum sp.]|jgi:hypothetical protein